MYLPNSRVDQVKNAALAFGFNELANALEKADTNVLSDIRIFYVDADDCV